MRSPNEQLSMADLLSLYERQYSPSAKLQLALQEAELGMSPERLRALQLSNEGAGLNNSRLQQLTPLEVESAQTQNRLANLMVDPTVEARQLSNDGLAINNRGAEVDVKFAEQSLPERLKRIGLENTAIVGQGVLSKEEQALRQRMFNTEVLQNDQVRRERQETQRRQEAMTLSQILLGLDSRMPNADEAKNVLFNAGLDVPQPTDPELLPELNLINQVEGSMEPRSIAFYGPRIFALTQKDPRTMLQLGPQARAILSLYTQGKQSENDLTTDERNAIGQLKTKR